MATARKMEKLDQDVYVELNDTLTSGITKSDPSKPISEILGLYVDGRDAVLYLRVNELSKASASSAALSWGEHVFTYPSGLGLVQPFYTSVLMRSTTDAAQAATAGEVGMGTTIGSGANATLGAVAAAAENVMEGTTIANHVADTELTTEEGNAPVAFGDHGAAGVFGILDASASDVKVHLNLATTYDNASVLPTVFSADIVHHFRILSSNFGVL